VKLLMKAVDMLCFHTSNGILHPVRFKWVEADGTEHVVHIDRVLTVGDEKFAGNPMRVFAVQSCIDKVDHRFEMKYETKSGVWYLSRM